MACVYLLESVKSGKTYVGATLDIKKRLRQHNCEISGGAKRTRRDAGGWKLACHVSGFRTFNECLKFEYAWRRIGKTVRRWDLQGRQTALEKLQAKKRWSSTSPLASEVCLTVKWTSNQSNDSDGQKAEPTNQAISAKQIVNSSASSFSSAINTVKERCDAPNSRKDVPDNHNSSSSALSLHEPCANDCKNMPVNTLMQSKKN